PRRPPDPADAEDAARPGPGEGVIAEPRQHRERAQPVDVGTIGVHRARDHLPHFRRGARSGQPATLVRTVVCRRWNMRRPLATLTTSMDTQAAAIRRYFDAASEHYASRRADEYSFVVQKRIALEFLATRTGRGLDIGCGTATLADDLLARTQEYCGIDLSPAMIEHGRARLESHPLASRCSLSVGDAQALAFPDGSFDAVVALGLLEYLMSYERALSEIWRVLRPGGVPVLALPHPQSPHPPLPPPS